MVDVEVVRTELVYPIQLDMGAAFTDALGTVCRCGSSFRIREVMKQAAAQM